MSLEHAYQLALRALRCNGFNQAHAETVAQNVIQGERDGCASHGLYRLLGCVRSLRAGKVSADAKPRLFDQAPAILRADAGGAFSLLAYRTALPAFIDKVRANGIAALAINRCVHFSALWADIEPLTEQGLVALACTPSHAWVTPAGGSRPLFGTNPSPSAGRARLGRRFCSTWPPARRRAAKSNCIAAPAPRCRKAGALIRQATPPPTPPACWRARC
ncbi:malate/L-lactate dehydrogenase family protein [Serratia ureilytica]|nr:malate/L-lactate dehydrogenase family protein [Serratia ureilytica]